MRYGCVSADGDEVAVPRGGASALTPLEYRQVRREAEESVLYGDDEDDEVDKKVACSHGSFAPCWTACERKRNAGHRLSREGRARPQSRWTAMRMTRTLTVQSCRLARLRRRFAAAAPHRLLLREVTASCMHCRREQIVTQGAERAVQVESLRFSKLRVGSLVLGVVRQLKIDEAIISLPNNLTGVVHCRCAYVPSSLAELHFVRDS